MSDPILRANSSHLSELEYKLSASTGQLDGWQRVEKWRKQCREQHPKCAAPASHHARLPSSPKWLPTRLIQVDSTVDDEPGHCRIVNTADL